MTSARSCGELRRNPIKVPGTMSVGAVSQRLRLAGVQTIRDLLSAFE